MNWYLAEIHHWGDVVSYCGRGAVVIRMMPSFDGMDDFLDIIQVEDGKIIETMDSGVDKVENPSQIALLMAKAMKESHKKGNRCLSNF